MKYFEELIRKLNQKKAVVSVIGLGYVGLPLIKLFLQKGFKSYGFDIDNEKIEKLKKGVSYIKHIDFSFFKRKFKEGKFYPTDDFKKLREVDVAIICVPTPLNKQKKPDLRFVKATAKTVSRFLKKGSLVVLESTTYPGTTREEVLPLFEKKGFKVGVDFFLAFSPEREDPGNKKFTTENIPKIVGGIEEKSTELTSLLYSKVVKKVIKVSSPEVAEATKMLENTFRAVNIALVNELKIFFDRAGINVWEVIKASSTKPFGFMPFYPGPGWGGHCLAGKEFVFVKNKGLETIRIEELYARYKREEFSVNNTEIVAPRELKVLSFNIEKRKTEYRKVEAITCRKYKKIIQFKTKDGRKIEVTDLHPLLVYRNGGIYLKLARDVMPGDYFIINHHLPNSTKKPGVINLIKHLKNEELSSKIRVKPKDLKLRNYAEYIKPYLRKYKLCNYRDYWRGNFLPFKVFLELISKEKSKIPFNEENLLLCTGSGSSITEIPAVFKITEDFSRLVGYYLSEGCITKDRSSRVRFSFNKKEKELINDTIKILKGLGIKYSVYNDKKWATTHIKISSEIFSFLFEKVLGCGTNSYNMKIPDIFMTLPDRFRENLLKGLLRGDGGVDFSTGKRRYSKNGKIYTHFSNSATVNYYTISPFLFQQIILLLQNFGVVPYFKKRYGLLNIGGYHQLKRIAPFFVDEKREKLRNYFEKNRKIISNKLFKKNGNFSLIEVKEKKKINFEKKVYSLEVEGNHTFISSYGLILHNCIPVDPFYLYWRAKKFGIELNFIKYAGEINTYMPWYVVGKLEESLKKKGKKLKGGNILILGVAYKKDIEDIRESPALIVFDILEKKGAKVSFYDPYVKVLRSKRYKRNLKRIENLKNGVKEADAVVVLTDHSNVDYDMVLREAKLIVDTRNVFPENEKVVKS